MGVDKKTIRIGNGVDWPKKGDKCIMEYTGFLYDPSQADNDFKGKQFDSSVGRGDFATVIGEGQVIKGWDEGILGTADKQGMSLGEKAILTMSSDYGYGERGFKGHIPPRAGLVFDVELKGINDKRA